MIAVMAPQRTATLRLKTDVVRTAMTSHGITSQEQLAEEISVGRATVIRAMSRRTAPGSALIAGLRLRLGLPLDQIVEVIPAIRRTA